MITITFFDYLLQYYSPFVEHDHMYTNNMKKIKHLDTKHKDGNKTSWGEKMKETPEYVVHLIHEAMSTKC